MRITSFLGSSVIQEPIRKAFRRSLIIRLYRFFRMTESAPMYLGVARMAKALQIVIIKH